jgi:monofunctional glycosyltransferase
MDNPTPPSPLRRSPPDRLPQSGRPDAAPPKVTICPVPGPTPPSASEPAAGPVQAQHPIPPGGQADGQPPEGHPEATRPSVPRYPVPAPVTVTPLKVSPPATEPDPAPPPAPPGGQPGIRPKRKWRRKLLLALIAPLVLTQIIAFMFSMGTTLPRTAYMLEAGEPVVYQFVSINHMNRRLLAATIAHEDEQLGTRTGAFDIGDFQARVQAYFQGKPDPSGSTIPQQLVKNIYLWDDQSVVRKGIEAVLATQFSYTVSAPRTLELYLNYAQFGPRLYGVCAASWYYFGTPPWNMTDYQSAQLMGVLPLPDLVRRAPDGGIYLGDGVHPAVWDLVNGAANVWVPRQIAGLGGWQAAVATVGISDTAYSHADRRADNDACSTMPESVRDRIQSEAG